MTKQRAEEILLAYACCSFTTTNNKLCQKCPWNETDDCENTTIDERLISEAVNILREERV